MTAAAISAPCVNCGRDTARERVFWHLIPTYWVCTFCGWRYDEEQT